MNFKNYVKSKCEEAIENFKAGNFKEVELAINSIKSRCTEIEIKFDLLQYSKTSTEKQTYLDDLNELLN